MVCPDLNADQVVDVSDLLQLLGAFGQTSGAALAANDVNGDGGVAVADLLLVLAGFGQRCQPPVPPLGGCLSACGANEVCQDGSCGCASGFRGGSCTVPCAAAVAHSSSLIDMESSLPCADCLVGCYAGEAEPDWSSAQETCSFLDGIFHIADDGSVLHNPCASQCDAYIAGHAIELYLACHGGTTVVGGVDDTVATVNARAELVERITGLCFTLQQELGQSWHGQEQCVDEEADCVSTQAISRCL